MRPIAFTTSATDKNNFYDTKYEEHTLQNCHGVMLRCIKEELLRKIGNEQNCKTVNKLGISSRFDQHIFFEGTH